MTQQLLHAAQIAARFQHMGRKRGRGAACADTRGCLAPALCPFKRRQVCRTCARNAARGFDRNNASSLASGRADPAGSSRSRHRVTANRRASLLCCLYPLLHFADTSGSGCLLYPSQPVRINAGPAPYMTSSQHVCHVRRGGSLRSYQQRGG